MLSLLIPTYLGGRFSQPHSADLEAEAEITNAGACPGGISCGT